jgi:hypothetical protein
MELIKVAESESHLEVVTQQDNPFSNQVGQSHIGLESYTNHNAKVSPSAFHHP